MNKDSVIIVGADYHGDWAKDVALTLREFGVSTELIFTNTLVKGTDNNIDVTKRARIEKVKRLFRNYARPVFNFVKDQRRRMSERELVRRIRSSGEAGGRQFVVFIWTPPVVPLLKKLKKIKGVKLILWHGEAPPIEPKWALSFPYFEHIFFVDDEWPHFFPENERSKETFLPLASSPAKFFPLKESERDKKFVSDIAFVGYYLDERAEMLSALKDLDLKIYGYWWENGMAQFPWAKEKYYGPISNEDANRVFNEGKIQIGRPLSIRAFPYCNTVTQRVFDISLAGNFQVSAYSRIIEKMFGDAVPTFRNNEELRKLVDHYLSRPEERRRLAAKAHAIALRDHTYANRIKTIIEVLGIER